MFGFANFQNQRDRSPDVTLFLGFVVLVGFVVLWFGVVFLLLCHVSNLLFLIMRAAISSAVITIEF